MSDYTEIVAMIGGGVIYALNELRKELKARKAERMKKGKGIDTDLALNSKIYPILWEIMLTRDVVRVYITQFHNGSNFYTGQSIQRQTVSHEVGQQNIKKIKDVYDNILISEMDHKILMEMKRRSPEPYSLDDIDSVTSQDLRLWMERWGIRSSYMFKIDDRKTGNTVAVLTVHCSVEKSLTTKKISDISDARMQLEGIFDEL